MTYILYDCSLESGDLATNSAYTQDKKMLEHKPGEKQENASPDEREMMWLHYRLTLQSLTSTIVSAVSPADTQTTCESMRLVFSR